MTNALSTISKEMLKILRKNIGKIFVIHLVYTALGVIFFTPLTGIVGNLMLRLSGREMLADQDIIYFLLTPSGIAILILFGGLLITIMAFEQASMMVVCGCSIKSLHIDIMQAFYFTARRAPKIFYYTIHLIVRLLILILPFLVAGSAVAWFLITDYDINYYLSEKPPQFLVAATLIGLILAVMLSVLIPKLLSWSLTLPLILFGDVSPSRSFHESGKLTQGSKRIFLLTLGLWAISTLLLGAIILGGITLLGSYLAPMFFNSLNLLVVVLGALLALWSAGNLFITTLTSGTFASLLVILYKRCGASLNIDAVAEKQQNLQLRMTGPRFGLLLAGCAGLAVIVGFWLLNDIKTDDHVTVIAHRGAAGKAPENSLASIRQAIKDATDWVEIDVQETADGEVVVIHDSDFMKLAGVDTRVWNGTLKELQEIDIGSWFAPRFSAERVPTLLQVLEEARGKARVMIELKYYGHDQQLEKRVIDIVEQTGMVNNVAIMSLKYDGVKKIRALRPDWIIGLLSAKAIGNISGIDVNFLAVNMAMATPHLISTAHSAGKQIFVWTVNDQVSMSRMMSLGVDGIITDEPALARTVLAERAEMSSVERLLIHTAILVGKPLPQKKYRDQSP